MANNDILESLKELLNIKETTDQFNKFIGKKCIVRSNNAGVFFGTLAEVSPDAFTVTMTNVRKIWYWEGAAAVEGLAVDGTTKPDECKFTSYVDDMIVTEVSQVLPATDKAIASIEAVPAWTASNN